MAKLQDVTGPVGSRPQQRAEWVILVLALLAIAGIGGYGVYRSRETLMQVERERLVQSAGAVAESIDRQIREIGSGLELLRSLLRTPSGRLDFAAVPPARLNEVAATMGGVASIAIVDAETTIVASTAREVVGKNFRGSDRDQAIRASLDAQTLYVFPPHVTPLGKYTIGIAKVLLDDRGRFGGFVLATLDPSYFDRVLKAEWYGPSDLGLGLIHGDGKLVYRFPAQPGLIGIDLSSTPDGMFPAHLRSGRQASVLAGVASATNESRIVAFHTAGLSAVHADKSVVVYASRVVDAMLVPWWKELVFSAMLLAALAVVSSAALAYAQHRRLAYSRLEQEHEAQGRRVQQELAVAEQRWKFALEGAAQGVWDWNMVDGTVFYSPQYKRMLGYGDEPWDDTAAAGFDRFHPDDVPALNVALDRYLRGETPLYETQFRARCKDGGYIWVESRGMVVERTPDGKPARMIGTHADITERKEQESELREASERLQLAEQAAGAGYWEWEFGSDRVKWSRALCAVHGLDPENRNPTYADWLAVVHPDDRAGIEAAIAVAVRDHAPLLYQYRITLPDGSTRWIEGYGRANYDADGRPLKMAGLGIDVSARHAKDEALRRASALLERTQFALESVGTAIYWADVASGRFVSANEAAARMLGYSREELERMSVPDIDPAVAPERYAAVAREIAEKGFLRFEAAHRRKDGGMVPVEMTVYHFAGSPARFVAFGVDISRRKADEQALRDLAASLEVKVAERTAQFAAASAAKSIFLANMSHEIRTPLNAILGLAQVLEQAAPAGSEQLDVAERIRDAGTVLLRTLNDVLDLSKIEAGQLQMEHRPFRLARLMDNVERMTRSMAVGKGLGLRIDVADCASLHLSGDSVRVEQVLLNLLSNAVKFTAHGDIVLSARVAARGAGSARLRFEVRDQGIGIPPNKLPALFAPFTQADSSIARRYGGTGLGLAISKHLVELMGGVIGVDSVEGAGSTFWFEVPFALAAPPVTGTPGESQGASPGFGAPGGPLRGLRVLVVDDSRMNLDVAERLLKRDGATVTLAGEGQQALEILRARPEDFDVVLMDVQMPVLDGLSATREIRHDPKLAELPVIALTAGVMPEEREAASVAGVDDFLPKPLDLKQMRAMLARYCPAA